MSDEPANNKVEINFPMKLFEDLASATKKQRITASDSLGSHLLAQRGSDREKGSAAYSIKRLVRGLASNRKMARVGFATALASCLSTECLPVDATLASLSDPTSGGQFLKTSGTMGKADRTHTIIGQLYFVAAISKGIIHSTAASPSKLETSDVTKLASLCVDGFKHKPVLRQMACSVLSQFIAAVVTHEESAQKNKAAIFKAIKPLLSAGWPTSTSDIDAADLLLLALVTEPVAPVEFWVESSWLSEDSAETRHQSFINSLLSDPGKVAAIIVSARQTPFVHLASVKLLESAASQLKRRKARKRFSNLWSELVNERLLLPASPLSHKTAALQLVILAITSFLRTCPSLIPVVLSRQLIDFLTSSLRRRTSREHEIVVEFFDELISALSKKDDDPAKAEFAESYYLTILACFLKPPIRLWHDFSSYFDKILHAAPPATVAQMSEIMKSIASTGSYSFTYNVDKGDGEEESVEQHSWEDSSAAFSARRFAVAHLAGNLTLSSTAQSSDDVVSIIFSVCESCLFAKKDNDELEPEPEPEPEEKEKDIGAPSTSKSTKIGLFPRDQAVNYVLRAVSSATSPGLAQHISGTAESITILKSVLSLLKKRMSTEDSEDADNTLAIPLSADAEKTFLSLLKISKKKTRVDSVAELLRLFACHAAVLLICYPNEADIVQLGKEVIDLFHSVAAQSDDDDSSSEGPARVFLDMLISLLSRKSRPVRQVTTSMFSKLISNQRLLGLLTSTSNADGDGQASSLTDLLVNALLNTQFVEDSKDDEDDDDDEDEGDKSNDEEDEGNGDDTGEKDDLAGRKGKAKAIKRKRTVSGHLVVPAAGANENNGGEDDGSVDSMIMDDEEMFKMDSLLAAALKSATASGGPAKRAKRERKNQMQQMKEFHMKLVSWLEMVIRQAQQLAKADSVEKDRCDGNKILIDIIGVLLSTLASKKKLCTMAIEIRLCQLVKTVILPWRQAKPSDGLIDKVADVFMAPFSSRSGVAPGEFILDSALQIVRNVSSTQDKLSAAASAVELLLMCSAESKSKSITSAIKNTLDAYLAHPSPHGNMFFSNLLSSNRLQVKQLERIFFDRLLKCVAGLDNADASSQQEDETEDKRKADKSGSTKTKSFPRSQAARLLATSMLTTAAAYEARSRLYDEIGSVLNEVLQSFATELEQKGGDDSETDRKVLPQPWLYRNIIDLAKRHASAVLASKDDQKVASLAQLTSSILTIREKSVGKKLADVRSACSAALQVLKRAENKKQKDAKPVKAQPKDEKPNVKTPEVKGEVDENVRSGKKRQNKQAAAEEKPSRNSPTVELRTPTPKKAANGEISTQKLSSSKKRKSPFPVENDVTDD